MYGVFFFFYLFLLTTTSRTFWPGATSSSCCCGAPTASPLDGITIFLWTFGGPVVPFGREGPVVLITDPDPSGLARVVPPAVLLSATDPIFPVKDCEPVLLMTFAGGPVRTKGMAILL